MYRFHTLAVFPARCFLFEPNLSAPSSWVLEVSFYLLLQRIIWNFFSPLMVMMVMLMVMLKLMVVMLMVMIKMIHIHLTVMHVIRHIHRMCIHNIVVHLMHIGLDT